MSDNKYPKTLAQIEADALAAQSVDRAIASIKEMTLRHRAEEAREECYQIILDHLSQWVAREDLEKYLNLTSNFTLPVWRNYRDEHYPIGIEFCLVIPGYTEIGCTAYLQKPWGYSIEVVNLGKYYAQGNPHVFLGEAMVTARREWLYKQKSYAEYRQSQEETARFYNGGDKTIDITEETEEIEIPF